jgi:RimJ/RimL family protein N-acetyltransferase
MAQHDPAVTDDERAIQALDVYFAMQLGCSSADLHRPGWTIVTARLDADPMALLFEQRPLLSLVAPASRAAAVGAVGATPEDRERPGVAMVTPELRIPLAGLLHDLPPAQLFTSRGLDALEAVMARCAPDRLTPPDEAHVCLAYATGSGFRPYVGQWQEWIEPLDEAAETEPPALALLARYSGVYVVRQRGAIVSFAGIRPQSPHVAEIGVRTDAEGLRGRGLGRAVVSRATKAVFAAGRVPLYRYHAGNAASEHVCRALGYRLYADSLVYFAHSR